MSKFLQQIQVREREARRKNQGENKKSDVGGQGNQPKGKELAYGGGIQWNITPHYKEIASILLILVLANLWKFHGN